MKMIYAPSAPEPSGHYSQAVVHAGLVFVSGQLPIDPKTGEKQLGTIEEQNKLLGTGRTPETSGIFSVSRYYSCFR